MKWVSSLSTKVSLESAVNEVTQQVLSGLEGRSQIWAYYLSRILLLVNTPACYL